MKSGMSFIKRNFIFIMVYIIVGLLYWFINNILKVYLDIEEIMFNVILVFYWILIVFIHAGILSILYKKLYGKEYQSFYIEAKKYFIPLLKTAVFLSIFMFIFLTPSIMYFNSSEIIVGKIHVIDFSSFIEIISISLFSLLTLYTKPIVFIKKIEGLKAIKDSIRYLFGDLKKSKRVIYIVLFRFFISLIILILVRYSPDSYLLLNFIEYLFLQIIDIFIFIVSIKILREK